MNEFAQRYEALVSGRPFSTEDGLQCRIIPGTKKPGDLVLEVDSAGGWRRVKFATLGLMVEFLYRNEDLLYPPDEGNKGGEYLMGFLRECLKVGHDRAGLNLEWQKAQKQLQIGLFEAAS